MNIDLIALAALGLSALGMAILAIRRFPALASIDVTASKPKLEERKSTIVEQRLKRKFIGLRERMSETATPVGRTLQSMWSTAHKRLADLEHEYKIRSLPVLLNQRQRRKVDSEIATILEQAQALVTEGEYAAAEEKALQAIRLEPKSVAAFELLGDLYNQTKEYTQAKEVYLYLLKLAGEDETKVEQRGHSKEHLRSGDPTQEPRRASDVQHNVVAYYLDLAQVYRAMEDWPLAFDSIQAAAQLMPYNPKVLDEYIEISIGYGKKGFAEDALGHMRQTNSHNSKIAEWEERIAAMERHPLYHTEEGIE